MSASDTRTPRVALLLAVALLSAFAGAAVAWFLARADVADLKAEVSSQDRTISGLEAKIAELQSGAENANGSGSEEPSTTPQPPTPDAATVTKQFAFIKDVSRVGAGVSIQADYAQMLTGDEAAAAATAHGDESPPPNDYYIVNDNPKVRALMVSPDAKVTLVTKSDGTVDVDGYMVTLSEFVALFGSVDLLKDAPFNLTITGGKVTVLAQQYLP